MSEPQIDVDRLAAFADLQLIDVAEMAHLAKTGEDWIRKGCQAQLFPYTRVGDSYRFTRDQVAEIWRIKTRQPAEIPTVDEVRRQRERAGRRKAAV